MTGEFLKIPEFLKMFRFLLSHWQNRCKFEFLNFLNSSREVCAYVRDCLATYLVEEFEELRNLYFFIINQIDSILRGSLIFLDVFEEFKFSRFCRLSLPDHTAFALPGPGEHAVPDRIPHARPLHPQKWRTTCTSRLPYPKQKTIWLWPDINLTGLPSWPLILVLVPAVPCGP